MTSKGFCQIPVILTVLIWLCLSANPAAAQVNMKGIDTLYGFDPLLYNGTYYTYKIPRNSKGNPFFWEDGFEKGSITILGRTYRDLELNYDAFNQVLLMKYVDHDGATNILEISGSWLGKFSVGASDFELIRQEEEHAAICQFISSGSVTVRYFWKKDLKLDNVFGTPIYEFSRPKREQVLYVNQKKLNFKNNREFIKGFEPPVQMKISNFIKSNKIKVAKSSDAVITQLVAFCNTQISQ
jgi:hypothetical protein